MEKIDPKTFNVDWQKLDKIAPWSVISSRQLSEILGCHLQSVANYRLRGHLPEPEHHPRLKGNKVYYRAASIRNWLTGGEEAVETWDWIRKYVGENIASVEQAQYVCKVGWKALEIEKPL